VAVHKTRRIHFLLRVVASGKTEISTDAVAGHLESLLGHGREGARSTGSESELIKFISTPGNLALRPTGTLNNAAQLRANGGEFHFNHYVAPCSRTSATHGTTYDGGSNNAGTIIQFTIDGALRTLVTLAFGDSLLFPAPNQIER
jgi:uncharacterized repeat protein (TIGR03803 family)